MADNIKQLQLAAHETFLEDGEDAERTFWTNRGYNPDDFMVQADKGDKMYAESVDETKSKDLENTHTPNVVHADESSFSIQSDSMPKKSFIRKLLNF